MLKADFLRRSLQTGLVENSPLRRADPRAKLAMALCGSVMVALPLERLALFVGLYFIFLAWVRLLPAAACQAWRLRWLLCSLFILDAVIISWELAIAVTLRLLLLAGTFSLLVATTTPSELSAALESLRLPYRYAFSLGLAFQSLGLVEEEWRAIQEAQRSRGIIFNLSGKASGSRLRKLAAAISGWRDLLSQARRLTALTVPAIVLTTRRAWSITEAAYARGFDSPRRQPYQRLVLSYRDWMYVTGAILLTIIFYWRWS